MDAPLSRRVGITRIEMLVVVAIIIFLVGFLLPRGLETQGAARRMACSSRLKGIAIACLTHADANSGVLPRGSIVGSASEASERLSFFVTILPQIGGDELHKEFDQSRGWASQKATKLTTRAFRCTMDFRSESSDHTNYVGVAGVGSDAATLSPNDKRAGVFGFDRLMRLTDIKDGTSNTLLFLETHHETGSWASAGYSTMRGIDPDEERPVGQGRAFGFSHTWGYTPGECPAAMADGSVRSLKATISAEVLSALATIAGGEDVSVMDW